MLLLALVLGFAVLFLSSLNQLDASQEDMGREQLQAAIRRAAVACYAAEGFYPPTIAYLQQHYGLQIDESRYIVFYEVFGENLMPEITVLRKET